MKTPTHLAGIVGVWIDRMKLVEIDRMTMYHFQKPPMQPRECEGCGERFPWTAPAFWRFCSRCYAFARFRQAAELLKAVRS